MHIKKNIILILSSLTIAASSLTGCSSENKEAISETATNFLDIVKSGSTDNIEQYASSDVVNGSSVKAFDASYLAEQVMAGVDSEKINDETKQKLDAFCSHLTDMVTGYEITSVSVDKKGIASVVATINTAFPINIIGCEEANEINKVKAEAYKENMATTWESEDAKKEYQIQVYNDTISFVIETYKDLMSKGPEMTYAIVLTLEKNADTDSWIVTGFQDLDSSVTGQTIADTKTKDDEEAEEAENPDATEETPAEESEEAPEDTEVEGENEGEDGEGENTEESEENNDD
ncbi:MAG: hypothetical protein J5802_02175 [Butyrivibrio sp.]|nr:hypothetical protein [Butyrivibrio sp.]